MKTLIFSGTSRKNGDTMVLINAMECSKKLALFFNDRA